VLDLEALHSRAALFRCEVGALSFREEVVHVLGIEVPLGHARCSGCRCKRCHELVRSEGVCGKEDLTEWPFRAVMLGLLDLGLGLDCERVAEFGSGGRHVRR